MSTLLISRERDELKELSKELYEAYFPDGNPSVVQILRKYGYEYEAQKIEAAIIKAKKIIK